ncbi:head completion/stabilization protein [Metapseudomonas lalkuanensis]|uniref:Head completion/stabilization protein n=1 Tax=Metapseudomonas lalkuanensis TaxID=2604832 RepID=A0A5J6QLP5_9GAMM|nr:head completion/stabilization protein [Pseudomonas lalkuanensis]QEY63353.1 head completion/stabilization protein [Pseudomonas lalkuanensis]
MSGFIAGGTPTGFTLKNDSWWPDIDGQDMRAVLRLDASITDARLKAAALNAMLDTNRELTRFKARHQALGCTTLEGVPADQVDGQSRLVILYCRALYCGAGAELTERYRALDSSADGHAKADALTPSIDELRRDQRWAIRDLLGLPRTTVELI